jgi:hypothetical protein
MMDTTTVVHVKDGSDVYIGRPAPRYGLPGSIWGNPYKIGDRVKDHPVSREEAIARYETRIRRKLAGPNRDWWRLELEKLRGKRLGCWCNPKPCHGHVLVKLLGEFELIAVENRRLGLLSIMDRRPGAMIIDVTSQAQLPWVKFSPLYPLGDIPVPYSPGWYASCVEGIWQGLKVFRGADVDTTKLNVTSTKGLKRTTGQYGHVLGHRNGVTGGALLSYYQARVQLYLPTYKWVLDNHLQAEIAMLREMVQQQRRPVVLLDYETNGDIEDLSKPLSHAALVALYIQGQWPEGRFAHLFRQNNPHLKSISE